jgi:tryptophan synthase alpha chain
MVIGAALYENRPQPRETETPDTIVGHEQEFAMNTTAIPKSPTTTRIARRFAELRRDSQMGLVAFLTAGDPSLAATESLVLALAEAGADVVELGVPFSDPVADGPAIQRSSERALRAGTTLAGVLDAVRAVRKKSDVALVLFSYYNPVLQMGLTRFAESAAVAGADGALITDLTPEESGDYRRAVTERGLDTIFLAAPTTPDGRMSRIAECSSGFLYLISRTGVTGTKKSLPEDLPGLVRRVRRMTSLPIAVGFGISEPGHVSLLGGLADAAVVGSALVEEIERAATVEDARAAVAARVRTLKQAGLQGMSRRELRP